jgi:uncharacterized membrane protein YfcA
MTITFFSLYVFGGSILAGVVGALTGLGGGVILVPMLVLLFHVNVHYAVGASLISVIATSSGATAAYLREGYTNLRVGMFLQVAAACGALLGAFVAVRVHGRVLAMLFGLTLAFSAYLSFRRREKGAASGRPDRLSHRLRLSSSYPVPGGRREYQIYHSAGGFMLMLGAGTLSGLLGIGSGAVKVLAMDQMMRLPYKVSTTTSNFMIGITAAVSVGMYLSKGFIDPGLTMPVMLGVLAGAMIGAKLLMIVRTEPLRVFFSITILALALEMIYSSLTGKM